VTLSTLKHQNTVCGWFGV